jgi:anti-sigma B factor antagonist
VTGGGALSVGVVQGDGAVAVVLRGELDGRSEPSAHAALVRASPGVRELVLDLSGLDFIDSSGLKLVLVWTRRLRESGTDFTILRGPVHVQRPFASAGLEGLLPFADRLAP